MKPLISLISVVLLCSCRSTLAYKAAVYEYHPVTADTPENTIVKNVQSLRDFASTAKNQGVSIMVFPEYGLTTLVSDPREYAREITDDDKIIKELKAIAIEHQVYLVVNLVEKLQETNSKTKYYNTNLVFHLNGSIIFKYRKINLFQEPYLTPGATDQILTFRTDFEVTFGIFTGFDIMFSNPSSRVLENSSVTDIIFPTAWASYMPFFTALSLQYGYSVANGLNLLAANLAKPGSGHGGSGIYSSRDQIIEAYIGDSPSSKPLIQDVPSITKREDRTTCSSMTPFALPGGSDNKFNLTNYGAIQSFDSSEYTSKNIDLTKESTSVTICDNGFCCTFDVLLNTTTSDSVIYKAIVYNGQANIDDFEGNLRICSLVVCENDAIASCGKRINSTTRFTKISVKGDLEKKEGTFYRPISLDLYYRPLTEMNFCDTNNGTSSDSSIVQFQTLKGRDNVIAFGIIGRASAASSIYSYGLLFFSILSMLNYILK